MDTLKQELAQVEQELTECLAQRNALSIKKEAILQKIAMCERVCHDKIIRDQLRAIIAQKDAEETEAELVMEEEPVELPETEIMG